jgi:hypothetical protein
MILKTFQYCPVCKTQDKLKHHLPSKYFYQISCKNQYDICGFHQYPINSFEDQEIKYFSFYTKDFNIYVYGENENNRSAINLTHIYYRKFPRGQSVQSPLITWENWYPDFNNLTQLNNKLNILSTFQ